VSPLINPQTSLSGCIFLFCENYGILQQAVS
jgi:hypothetical protein